MFFFFREAPDGKIEADYKLLFPPGSNPSVDPLRAAIASGIVGGMPVFKDSMQEGGNETH